LKYFKLIIILFLFLNCFDTAPQQIRLDSLLKIIKTEKNDSVKVNCLLSIADYYSNETPDKAIYYANKAKNTAIYLKNRILYARCLMEIGWYYYQLGNYAQTLKNYFEALKVYKPSELKYTSAVLTNIGDVFLEQKDYEKAKEYYLKALKIDEETLNKNGIAVINGNIGIVYEEQKDYENALEYFYKSLTLNKELLNEALESKNSHEINENKKEIAIKLGNIGNLYASKIENDKLTVNEKNELLNKALDYLLEGLKIDYELNRKNGIATKLGNIGILYKYTMNYKLAENYLQKALLVSDSIKAIKLMIEWHKNLSQIYEKTNQTEKSYKHYKKHIELRDSIYNSDNAKNSSQVELSYEFDKKMALKKAEKEKKDAIAKAEKRKQQIVIWAVGIGLILVLIFTTFILRSLKLTKKQKKIIEEQKQIVEEKQNEIIDSLNYAKHLQNAILPTAIEWQKHLPNSFILYKPKDIVSGDFYWLTQITTMEPPLLIFAVADCTGHGVPGAMVSVVCCNALNRVVKEFNITEPGKILDKTKELVVEHFTKGSEDVKDGMDISLCSLYYKTDKIILKWAGANNPLWVISSVILNDSEESNSKIDVSTHNDNYMLTEFKPDKHPVGKTDNNVPFTTHNIELQKNDSIYIFSDGYQDQFGGEQGKKFKTSQMRELFLSVQNKTMNEQKKIISYKFDNWKENLEQVDDICIIGVKV